MLILSLLVTSLLLFAAPPNADAQELGESQTAVFETQNNYFELHIGMGYLLAINGNDAAHGASATISDGYRWSVCGTLYYAAPCASQDRTAYFSRHKHKSQQTPANPNNASLLTKTFSALLPHHKHKTI